LTENFQGLGLAKGVTVGDACARLQQTVMFDLPILDRNEVQALMRADATGSRQQVSR